MWGPDAPPVSPKTAIRWFSIAATGFVAFGFLTKYALVAERPAVAREYPFSGLVTELGGLEENQVRLRHGCYLMCLCVLVRPVWKVKMILTETLYLRQLEVHKTLLLVWDMKLA